VREHKRDENQWRIAVEKLEATQGQLPVLGGGYICTSAQTYLIIKRLLTYCMLGCMQLLYIDKRLEKMLVFCSTFQRRFVTKSNKSWSE
jgi:hypothetical protein